MAETSVKEMKTGEIGKDRLQKPRLGDPDLSPRCNAVCKRTGAPCRGPAVRRPDGTFSKKCRLHGGKSTGPRTPEGIERIRRALTTHGKYTPAAKAERTARNAAKRRLAAELTQLGRQVAEIQAVERKCPL